MASKGGRDNTVAGEIRKYIDKHPEDGPSAVAEALNKAGIETTAQYVSTIKNLDKKKSGALPNPRKSKAADIPYATLLEAKRMAKQLGGVDKAKQILDALSNLVE